MSTTAELMKILLVEDSLADIELTLEALARLKPAFSSGGKSVSISVTPPTEVSAIVPAVSNKPGETCLNSRRGGNSPSA